MERKMLKKILGFVLAAIIMQQASAHAGEVKIAVINMNKALSDTDDGKAALLKLQSRLDTEYKILQGRQAELKKLEEEITQQGYMLSDSARAEKQDKLRQAAREFEKAREEKNKEFVEAQKEATGKIIKKLNDIIKSYSKAAGFTLVLESSSQTQGMPGSVVWFDDKMDITDKVIELYNSAGKTTEKPK
jgi:outer membrane protein